ERQGGGTNENPSSGFLAPPGSYTVTLAKRVDGRVTDLGGPTPFEVVQMREGALPQAAPEEVASFMREAARLQRAVTAAAEAMELGFKRIKNLETALARSTTDPGGLDSELAVLKSRLFTLEEALKGNTSERQMGEPQVPSVAGRLRVATMGDRLSTYGPTATHRRSLEIATEGFRDIRAGLASLLEVDLPALEKKMEAAGVPWTPGRPLP
ncbi:MAG: glycosyl hydrolase, partial [Thermoanaerobaculales bacterium]